MAAVWERSKHQGGALLVLLGIADHANDLGVAYPSIERLARKARVTERHARRLIRQLADSGELKVEAGAGPHGTNLYRLNLPLTDCPPDKLPPDPDVRVPLTPASVPPDMGVSQTIIEPSVNHHALSAKGKIAKGNSTKGKRRRRKIEYSPDYERAWALYPQRSQGDSKLGGFEAWNARLRDNPPATPIELIAAVERYASYVRATGTTFIKEAATFFGTKEFWKQPWAVPEGGGGRPRRDDGPTMAEVRAQGQQ
jgi:hypothetical protein